MAQHGLYDNSPKIAADEEGNKKVVKEHKEGKGKKESGASDLEVHGSHAHARRSMHHRHIKEHLDMHHEHEMAHHHHKGDKKALHEKHEREYSEMHSRHATEMKKMHDSHEKEPGMTASTANPDRPLKEVEKGEK